MTAIKIPSLVLYKKPYLLGRHASLAKQLGSFRFNLDNIFGGNLESVYYEVSNGIIACRDDQNLKYTDVHFPE